MLIGDERNNELRTPTKVVVIALSGTHPRTYCAREEQVEMSAQVLCLGMKLLRVGKRRVNKEPKEIIYGRST